ncbi:MAG: transaldolase, partial [Dactylosporangium sp.]|nr:transaldolase [Dactylosporangium sp.]
VNTMPQETIDAFADHGEVRADTVTGAYDEAQAVLDELADLGVDYDDVVATLEREGVEKFEASWLELLRGVEAQLSGERTRLAERDSRAAATGGAK